MHLFHSQSMRVSLFSGSVRRVSSFCVSAFSAEGVNGRLQVRTAGFTIPETTQTLQKMLTLGLNIIVWALCQH